MTYDLSIEIQIIINRLEEIKKEAEELHIQNAIGELYKLEYEKLLKQIKDTYNGSKD